MTKGSSSRSPRISETPASEIRGGPPVAAGDPEAVDRRGFLVAGLAILALPGCTVPVRSFRSEGERSVKVSLALYPELEKPGGRIKVDTPNAGSIFLSRLDSGHYIGLSTVCTHQGCDVTSSGSGFRCPCHGSRYDALGKNIRGPARRPLKQFRARRDGEFVVLDTARRRS